MRRLRRLFLPVATAAVLVGTVLVGAGWAQSKGDPVSPGGGDAETTATTIAEDLTVAGRLTVAPPSGIARLRLEDPSGQSWEVNTDAGDFSVMDANTDFFPFYINPGAPPGSLILGNEGTVVIGAGTVLRVDGDAATHTLVLRSNRRVGIGAPHPLQDLHIGDGTGVPTIRLSDWGPSPRTFDLRVKDNQLQVFDATGNRIPLRIKPAATNNTLVLSRSGRVGIGIANPTQALAVKGNIVATGSITPMSGRAAKAAFAPIDAAAVLEALAALDVTSWSYRHDPAAVRHIGPTAEDFAAAFGIGDPSGGGIATVDADGVALASIQALLARVADLEAQVISLQAQLDADGG